MSSSSLQWATLDEILDKLLFVSVSGDGMILCFLSVKRFTNVVDDYRPRLYPALFPHLSAFRNATKRTTGYAKADD